MIKRIWPEAGSYTEVDGQATPIPERKLCSIHEAHNAAAQDDARATELVLGRMTSTADKWIRKASSFAEWMPEYS